uniref:Uncharacterized protein n=1 Tax=Aegilops tauschii subsp. strangulata TaxID=200361 RepID=A0A453MT97_AEGTS
RRHPELHTYTHTSEPTHDLRSRPVVRRRPPPHVARSRPAPLRRRAPPASTPPADPGRCFPE